MAKTSIQKRREVRALEAKRDELLIKATKIKSEAAAVKAALKQRRRSV